MLTGVRTDLTAGESLVGSHVAFDLECWSRGVSCPLEQLVASLPGPGSAFGKQLAGGVVVPFISHVGCFDPAQVGSAGCHGGHEVGGGVLMLELDVPVSVPEHGERTLVVREGQCVVCCNEEAGLQTAWGVPVLADECGGVGGQGAKLCGHGVAGFVGQVGLESSWPPVCVEGLLVPGSPAFPGDVTEKAVPAGVMDAVSNGGNASHDGVAVGEQALPWRVGDEPKALAEVEEVDVVLAQVAQDFQGDEVLTVVRVVTGGWVKDAGAEPALGHPKETASGPKDRGALVIIEPVTLVCRQQRGVSVPGVVIEQADGELLRVLEVS